MKLELNNNQRVDLFNKIIQLDKPSKSAITKLIKEEQDRDKEYMVHAESGGWNTVYAKNEKGALKAAKEKFKGSKFKVASVSLATEEGIKSAMSLFY